MVRDLEDDEDLIRASGEEAMNAAEESAKAKRPNTANCVLLITLDSLGLIIVLLTAPVDEASSKTPIKPRLGDGCALKWSWGGGSSTAPR
jgi:hypothetical protein